MRKLLEVGVFCGGGSQPGWYPVFYECGTGSPGHFRGGLERPVRASWNEVDASWYPPDCCGQS
jgi:hypothetical protein